MTGQIADPASLERQRLLHAALRALADSLFERAERASRRGQAEAAGAVQLEAWRLDRVAWRVHDRVTARAARGEAGDGRSAD